MKILITGANGQLGRELCLILKNGESTLGKLPEEFSDCNLLLCDLEDLDITNRKNTLEFIACEKPDVLINCAAYTNVDGAEDDTTPAYSINADGVKNLCDGCKSINADFVHISTDYVFDGESALPYTETAPVNPKSIYGKSKALGEKYALEYEKTYVVRTAWLYGKEGKNFVKTISRLAGERDTLTVVNDQTGCPTNAEDLAHHILKLIISKKYGIYHCTGKGQCTWYDFACEIVNLTGENCAVSPCSSKDYPQKAKRPAFSVLDNTALDLAVGNEMRFWRDALKDFLESEKL